jgi:hypothetical protein
MAEHYADREWTQDAPFQGLEKAARVALGEVTCDAMNTRRVCCAAVHQL